MRAEPSILELKLKHRFTSLELLRGAAAYATGDTGDGMGCETKGAGVAGLRAKAGRGGGGEGVRASLGWTSQEAYPTRRRWQAEACPTAVVA